MGTQSERDKRLVRNRSANRLAQRDSGTQPAPRCDLASLRRVVVVKALHLGDLLLTVPAFRALRHACPAAEISLIGLPWAQELVRRLPYLDRLIPFAGYPGVPEVEFDQERLEAFLQQCRAERFDLAVQLHGNGIALNPFVAALGARLTAGYYVDPDQQHLLAYSLPYRDGEPEVLRCLRLVQLLGAVSQGTHLEFPVSSDDRRELERLTEGAYVGWPRPVVTINPGARSPARRWPVGHFAEVAAQLWRSGVGTLVLVGGPREEHLAAEVAVQAGVPTINLAGKTSLGGLAALLEHADLLVSNDTGTAHLAVAVGTKSITIFGPADIRRWAPLDQTLHRVVRRSVPCQPCLHWDCPADHQCLVSIEPAEVVALSRELLRL